MEVALINCATVGVASAAAYDIDGRVVRTITALLHSCALARAVLCVGFLCSIAVAVATTRDPRGPAAIAWGVACVSMRDRGALHDAGAVAGFAGMLATARGLLHGPWREWAGWVSTCACFALVSARLNEAASVELALFAGAHVPLLWPARYFRAQDKTCRRP